MRSKSNFIAPAFDKIVFENKIRQLEIIYKEEKQMKMRTIIEMSSHV